MYVFPGCISAIKWKETGSTPQGTTNGVRLDEMSYFLVYVVLNARVSIFCNRES